MRSGTGWGMSNEIDAASAFFMEAFTPEHRNDPYVLYRRMREHAAFVHTDLEIHLAFGHAECWAALRNPALSSDERHSELMRRGAETDDRIAGLMDQRPLLVFMDPPDHTRLRNLVAQGFTPRRVASIRDHIQAVTDELIDEIDAAAGDGPVDLVERLAYPLPVRVICGLLGVPASDHELFGAWSAALTKGVDPGVLRSEEDNRAMEVATVELNAYTADLLARLRRAPADNLLSDLAARSGVGVDDHLTDDELIDLVTLLLIAGHETTVNLIGNGVVALLDHPDEMQAWRDDPALGERAVDELLRFDSPLQMVQRTATEDVEIASSIIPAGHQIIVMLGAANRDPEVFPEPDRLDLRRANANRHVAFGGGIHHCLGAALARTEGEVAITSLLRRFATVEAAGEAPIRSTFNLRGREHLPLTLRR